MSETDYAPPFCQQLTYRDCDGVERREVLTGSTADAEKRAREVNSARDDDGGYLNSHVNLQRRPTVAHGRELLMRALNGPFDGAVDMHVDELLELLIDAGWKAPGT